MYAKKGLRLLIVITTELGVLLAACQPMEAEETQVPVVETMVVTETVEATPVEVIQVVTPTAEPAGPRTLVICLDEEPDDLLYVQYPEATHFPVEEALFDGPIDNNSFAYQPVILEKLPSLADGDATLTAVSVSEGDTVVDAFGNLVFLDANSDPPIVLTPTGGSNPVSYQGGGFELDQMTATFKLLPNLKWSDGVPITAADSVYAFNLDRDERIESYEALDDVTIQWTGLPGFRDNLYSVFMLGPVPEHTWSQYSYDELEGDEELFRSPVGWGPYMMGEWIEGESITLHKNPYYFRANEGLPKFDSVIFRFTGDNTNANIAALLAGECDLISAPLDDQIEILLELHESGKIKATFTTGGIWEHIDFSIQHIDYDDGYQPGVDRPDFFSDVRTRQAFAMCMDRQGLVDAIFYGQSMVPDTYMTPLHPLYNPDVRHYEFNVAAANALLEEIGWVDEDGEPDTPRVALDVPNVPDGTLLEVDYETSNSLIRQQVVPVIKESLAQCGINAKVRLYSSDELFADGPEGLLWGRHYDLGQYAWDSDPVPSCYIYLSSETPGPSGATWISIQDGIERSFGENEWGGENNVGFTSDDYDRACNIAIHTLPGQPEYVAAHQEVQRIFSEQVPAVPLYLRIRMIAMRPDMCGVIMDPSNWSELWNIEEFDYGEGCEG